LAGIGFTVSLFVTGLAFMDPALTDLAKIGIFAGSGIAGIIGYLILRFTGRSSTASLP
jgi:Na+/H+ antiporter NhaA